MKKIFLSLSILLAAVLLQSVNAQMSVGTSAAPNANAVLDLVSSNQGLLLPRVALSSTTSASPLSAHVAGMHVYNTATAGTYPNNVTPSEYYNDGSKWIQVTSAPDMAIGRATLGAGVNVLNDGKWRYTGTSITLPPGKWRIDVVMVLHTTIDGVNTRITGANEYYWAHSSFATSTTLDSNPSSDIEGAFLISGALPSNAYYSLVNGYVIVNNASGANKTYYYMGRINQAVNAPAGVAFRAFGGTGGGENGVTYQKVQ